MSCSIKMILYVGSLLILIVSIVHGENCTIKRVSDGVIYREVVLMCPTQNSTLDAKFCCYDSVENSVECCNAVDRVHNILQKYMPSLLILVILVVSLILACCVICICIPCYCIMRRRPTYKESNDNTNMIAVSLPNESEEENTPKKEVTHHLPPGAYPVYPQFMGMQPLKSTEVNC